MVQEDKIEMVYPVAMAAAAAAVHNRILQQELHIPL